MNLQLFKLVIFTPVVSIGMFRCHLLTHFKYMYCQSDDQLKTFTFTRLAVRLIVHNYIFDIVVIFFVATTIFKCPILSVRNIIAWHMSFYLDFLFIFVCYYNVSHLWCFVCMRIGLFLCFYVCSFNFLLAKPSKANKRVSVQPRRGSLPLESLPPPLLRR